MFSAIGCIWQSNLREKMNSGEVDGLQREMKGNRESSEYLSLIGRKTPRASQSQEAEKAH